MRFRHPVSGQELTQSAPWLWVLLFGPFYFLFSGFFALAFLYVVGSVALLVTSLFIAAGDASGQNHSGAILLALWAYNLFAAVLANDLVRRHYVKKGWIPV